jgi:hypothetical protein
MIYSLTSSWLVERQVDVALVDYGDHEASAEVYAPRGSMGWWYQQPH